MAATITVRALDPGTWDARRGTGLSSFLSDREAVAQIIATRLKLLTGEWYETLSDGTPLFQRLLGHPTTTQAVALLMRQRILGSPYVTGIASLAVTYSPAGRTFAFAAIVQTQFGLISVGSN